MIRHLIVSQKMPISAATGESGRALIKQKFEIVYSYMEQTWGINLDELRDIVLRRQDDIANGNVDLSIIE